LRKCKTLQDRRMINSHVMAERVLGPADQGRILLEYN
jgi:hypothetical protein